MSGCQAAAVSVCDGSADDQRGPEVSLRAEEISFYALLNSLRLIPALMCQAH